MWGMCLGDNQQSEWRHAGGGGQDSHLQANAYSLYVAHTEAHVILRRPLPIQLQERTELPSNAEITGNQYSSACNTDSMLCTRVHDISDQRRIRSTKTASSDQSLHEWWPVYRSRHSLQVVGVKHLVFHSIEFLLVLEKETSKDIATPGYLVLATRSTQCRPEDAKSNISGAFNVLMKFTKRVSEKFSDADASDSCTFREVSRIELKARSFWELNSLEVLRVCIPNGFGSRTVQNASEVTCMKQTQSITNSYTQEQIILVFCAFAGFDAVNMLELVPIIEGEDEVSFRYELRFLQSLTLPAPLRQFVLVPEKDQLFNAETITSQSDNGSNNPLLVTLLDDNSLAFCDIEIIRRASVTRGSTSQSPDPKSNLPSNSIINSNRLFTLTESKPTLLKTANFNQHIDRVIGSPERTRDKLLLAREGLTDKSDVSKKLNIWFELVCVHRVRLTWECQRLLWMPNAHMLLSTDWLTPGLKGADSLVAITVETTQEPIQNRTSNKLVDSPKAITTSDCSQFKLRAQTLLNRENESLNVSCWLALPLTTPTERDKMGRNQNSNSVKVLIYDHYEHDLVRLE